MIVKYYKAGHTELLIEIMQDSVVYWIPAPEGGWSRIVAPICKPCNDVSLYMARVGEWIVIPNIGRVVISAAPKEFVDAIVKQRDKLKKRDEQYYGKASYAV